MPLLFGVIGALALLVSGSFLIRIPEPPVEALESSHTLKKIMVLLGARTIDDLRTQPVVVLRGALKEWLMVRGMEEFVWRLARRCE